MKYYSFSENWYEKSIYQCELNENERSKLLFVKGSNFYPSYNCVNQKTHYSRKNPFYSIFNQIFKGKEIWSYEDD